MNNLPLELNKGVGSRFCIDSQVRYKTPEEDRRTHRLKLCEYNNRDEDNSSIFHYDNKVNVTKIDETDKYSIIYVPTKICLDMIYRLQVVWSINCSSIGHSSNYWTGTSFLIGIILRWGF